MDKSKCSHEGCDKPVQARGLCVGHYNQWNYRRVKAGEPLPPTAKRNDGTCSVDGCENPARDRGWCTKHYQRWKKHGDPGKVTVIRGDNVARLWAKVDKRGPDECWPWIGRTHLGYGWLGVIGSNGIRLPVTAHRFAYQISVGPIPDGLHIDHRCHVAGECMLTNDCPHRRCCNPAHLAPATPRENTLRGNSQVAVNVTKTHCPQGHEYDEANTYVAPRGDRHCRACARESTKRRYYARRREGPAAA